MTRWMRRVRGALGMGMAWGTAWLGAGLVLLLIVGPDVADVPFPLGFGALGFLAGVTFAGVLGLMEGRRSFEQMSVPRFAGWGAAGGFAFAVLFVIAVAVFGNDRLPLLMMGPIFAAAGAGSAAGSLALARMGDDAPRLDPGSADRDGRRLRE